MTVHGIETMILKGDRVHFELWYAMGTVGHNVLWYATGTVNKVAHSKLWYASRTKAPI